MENQQQQLALISEMIATARKEFHHNGAIYLLWGWLVCIAAISQYVLLQFNSQYSAIPWLLMPIGAIIQFVMMRKQRNHQKVKTHVGRIIGYTWAAFGISIIIVLFMAPKLQLNAYPVLMILYAIGIFISGGALQVRPMIWGAIGCWICAIVSFFVDFEQQLLLLAAAVIVAYIIPGYILNYRYKKMQAA